MLEVRNVIKTFGGLQAVAGCSLSVKKGTITGLIGPNGAGKTTLFNLITGFYKPDRGQIFFHNRRIDHLPPYRIFHRKIFRTFQITREFNRLTVLENMMIVQPYQVGERLFYTWLPGRIIKKEEQAIKVKALAILDFMELSPLKDEYAGSLSGGQKKLLELAKSMMAEPDLVLLDEPGAGVNPSLMKRLVAKIQVLAAEKGITFFLIEHDMDMVMKLCNPVIVMSEGKKLTEGTPDEVRKHEGVLEAYLGGQYGYNS